MAMDISTPKGEISWVRCSDAKGTPRYLITSNKTRDHYFLYKIDHNKLEKIAKAKTPSSFDSQIKL